jgi:hypothetical protein
MTVVTVEVATFGRTAVDVVRAFEAMDPIVMVSDHDAEQGVLRLDPENLDDASADLVIDAFRRLAP